MLREDEAKWCRMEGSAACRSGLSRSENPYPTGTSDSRHWDRGYQIEATYIALKEGREKKEG